MNGDAISNAEGKTAYLFTINQSKLRNDWKSLICS